MTKPMMIVLALGMLSSLLLAACRPASGLEGTTWQLSEMNGQALPPDILITLEFQDEQAGGTAACNSYGAAYTLKGDRLGFETPMATLMYCDGVMDYESEYLRTLPLVVSYQFSDGRLELLDEAGAHLLVFGKPQAPSLEGTSWRVNQVGDRAVPDSMDVSMAFAEGKATGKSACNRYFASYVQNGESLTFNAAGASKMYCSEEGVMEMEAAFLQALDGVRLVRQSRFGLDLLDEQGNLLISLVP